MLKKTLAAGAIATAAMGGAFLASAPAFASEDVMTSGNGSVLSGNQAVVDTEAPVNVCGNSVAVAGISNANCQGSGAIVDH